MPRAVRSRDLDGIGEREARVFRALAHPTRRRILHVIGGGELPAGAVARAFPVSRPAVSRHLRVLLDAGLVTVRVAGRERRYAVAPGPLRDAAAHVQDVDAFWRGRLQRLGAYLAVANAAAAPAGDPTPRA